MRECILGNFRRRLISVLKTSNDLQRPSMLESLIRRQMTIIHLAEQHVSMDLTHDIRQVLLTESFSGPISALHSFNPATDQPSGSAAETLCNWYIDTIVKDLPRSGVTFAPNHNRFLSTRPISGYFAESITNMNELKAFVRLFGGYGVDRLKRMTKEHIAALLNCIGTSLRSNRDILEAVVESNGSTNMNQIVDLETVVDFCVQAGHALAFDKVISEAYGGVLEENAGLIYSLLEGVVKHLPGGVLEKKDVKTMREVGNSIGVVVDEHDTVLVRSIMEDMWVGNDTAWVLLPYLFSSFMSSSVWGKTMFSVETGGFNNNVHCLARCMNAVIVAYEYVRIENDNQMVEPIGNIDEDVQIQMQSSVTAQASAKSTLQLLAKLSAGYILDRWNESNGSDLAPKLIFLDQLCQISPLLPRSSIEPYIPYAILRSIYSHYYGNSPSIPLTLQTSSPHSSPMVPPTHGSPAFRQVKGGNSKQWDQLYDAENGSIQSNNDRSRYRNVRSSGPLDYGSSRKPKFNEGSTSGAIGPSPLPRFAVSRSGPISYK